MPTSDPTTASDITPSGTVTSEASMDVLTASAATPRPRGAVTTNVFLNPSPTKGHLYGRLLVRAISNGPSSRALRRAAAGELGGGGLGSLRNSRACAIGLGRADRLPSGDWIANLRPLWDAAVVAGLATPRARSTGGQTWATSTNKTLVANFIALAAVEAAAEVALRSEDTPVTRAGLDDARDMVDITIATMTNRGTPTEMGQVTHSEYPLAAA